MDIHEPSLGQPNPLVIRNRFKRDPATRRLASNVSLAGWSPVSGQIEPSGNRQISTEYTNTQENGSGCNNMIAKSYDEVIYDFMSSILSSIIQFFTVVYKTSHKAYIRHKERTNKVDLYTVHIEKDDNNNDNLEESDTEESLIIVDVKNNNTNNVFEPLLHFEHEEKEDGANEDRQYGTSLSIARYPRFNTTRSYTPMAPAGYPQSKSRKPDTSNLSILQPTRINDYDSYVSKFYLPHEPVSKNKYSLVDTLIDNFFVDGISDIFKERKERRQLISKERENLRTKLLPLSKDRLHDVNKFWNQDPSMAVSSAFQIEITTRDLQTLCDGQWLNDNIIDFYFNLITAKNQAVFGWTTHFFTTLKLKGYQGVARWSKRKKVNVTEKDLILIPINIMGTHWALAAVNNKEKCFQYYDSLSSNGNLQALQIIKNYMTQEGRKQNSSINFDEYSITKSMPSPQQQNGFDCGVFTCVCAKYVSQAKGLTYGQKDMRLIRRRMAYEIITKDLLD